LIQIPKAPRDDAAQKVKKMKIQEIVDNDDDDEMIE
jgi:ATP-dependent Clp protease ATP-binding subunit ClpB